MFRNQYDNDVTTWSPQGRLHQVEYAMEAVKQGSAVVGLKSKTHAVLVALKRATNDLAACQKKIMVIDDHMGFGIAGLTADARIIARYMRTECMNNRYVYETPMMVNRMVAGVGNKMQTTTQRYDKRPYGVGLLIIGHDERGPHVFQTCPSSAYYDCRAMAIGARSQSARTYMEKNLDIFVDCSLEELIQHGLRALRDTLPNDAELTTRNTTIAAVGKDMDFTIYDGDDVGQYLVMIEGEDRGRGPPPGADEPPALRPESPQRPPMDPEADVAMETQ